MKLHADVYKIVDPRVDSVLTGKLSLESFARTLTANDPFILVGDTIYALSEDEFYSTRSVKHMTDEYEQAFKYVLSQDDISYMTPDEQAFVAKVKKELPTCPVCKYKRYRQAVHRLAVQYKLPIFHNTYTLIDSVQYPQTKGPIANTVTGIMEHLYEIPKQERKPCIDCVEKHVAQAYILAQESEMGYPEHRILMCGHLAEAIDETPKDLPELKHTLQSCLATTMKLNQAFLPLYPILALIKMVRQHINQEPVDDDSRTEAPPVTDTIDLVPEIQQELTNMQPSMQTKVFAAAVEIRNAILEYKVTKKEEPRIRFEGLVANLSDTVLAVAPLLANMLRNRRLLFVADPALAVDAGYNFEDIIALVKPAY